MPRRLRTVMLLAGLSLPLAACNQATPPANNGGTGKSNEVTAAEKNVDIGAPLYTAEPYAATPRGPADRMDPVVVPLAQMSVTRRLDIQSQTDGFIYFIGTEAKAGQMVASAADVWTHPATGKKYVRLREGDTVDAGQVLVLLDDQQAGAENRSLIAAENGAKQDITAGEKMVLFSKNLLKIQEELLIAKATNKVDMFNAQATVTRYEAELASKQAMLEKAKAEKEKSAVRLAMHEIKTTIPGRVDKILKRPGEAVKATETILQLINLDKLRVEGYLPLEYAGKITKGDTAIIEPTILQAPAVTHLAHRLPVTDLAVSDDATEPLLLTASEDGTVLVCNTKQIKHVLEHPTAVHAVACTSSASGERIAVTGADDGKIRLWDLNALGENPKPAKVFDDGHNSAVLAAAFSPDGQSCATADDRGITIWDVKAGKKRYQVAGHRAPITDLHFTPQCRLVSASKDNTIRIWELGQKAARVERQIEHRSGEVPQLGVSADGNSGLFDQGKSTLHVVSLRDGRTESVIDNVIDQAKFTTLAKFSPDGKQVLSASATDGILQLWRLPDAKDAQRVTELRRFVCPNGSSPTCAEFVKTQNGGLVVVGTQSGHLHVWQLPTKAELEHQWRGTVTFIDPAVDTGGRQLRVWAEFENNGESKLRPGTTASLVVPLEGPVASK